jgi:DnaJ-class molecular chaperone
MSETHKCAACDGGGVQYTGCDRCSQSGEIVRRDDTCLVCHGSGTATSPAGHEIRCPVCDGNGFVIGNDPCPDCNGTGFHHSTCPSCDGSGAITVIVEHAE